MPAPVLATTCAQENPDNCTARVNCQITYGERHFIRSVDCICSGDCKLNDFVGLAVEASRYIFGITGSLALIMFAVGGFWWLTAAGEIESAIASGSFPPNPGPLCISCEFEKTCAGWTGDRREERPAARRLPLVHERMLA